MVLGSGNLNGLDLVNLSTKIMPEYRLGRGEEVCHMGI